MSKVINGTILKKINDDLEYFSKEQLRIYLNQMQGQVENIAHNRDMVEMQAKYWLDKCTRIYTSINKYYSMNIFKRIYLAIIKDIR